MKPLVNSQTDICPIFIRLPKENIAPVKFIFETYEGLCEFRSLDSEKAEVVLLAVPDTLEETRQVLASIKLEYNLTEIPAPKNVEGDWLLSESLG